MKKVAIITLALTMLVSCVSKKKYTALESDLTNTKGELQKTTLEKESLEAKFSKIQERVTAYNTKINTLSDTNNSLNQTNSSLNQSLVNVNNEKLVLADDNSVVISKNVRAQLDRTIAKIPYEEIKNARTLKDSINLAISYNLRHKFSNHDLTDAVEIGIDKTVVMISVSDKMLFSSGSYRVKSQASSILTKLAEIINSEPSMDVIIEGHTDSQTIKKGASVMDNWDLSVKRATAIVRELQNKYQVEPSRLIASGRSSYVPVSDNSTKEGRARNRRTNIIILPNLNKFFALLAQEENILE